jgi:hypothetical protein
VSSRSFRKTADNDERRCRAGRHTGILCHSRNPPPVLACGQWVDDLLAKGRRVIIREIADYKRRRRSC